MEKVNRFSGLDWFTEVKDRDVMIIGAGGIGSYTAYNLARIGFSLSVVDPDTIDSSNITGGQLYRTKDLYRNKAEATIEICREFGATSPIYAIPEYYSEDIGTCGVMVGCLDNMLARKLTFEEWAKSLNQDGGSKAEDALFIDGRLGPENFDVFCIQGNKPEQIEEYRSKWLFDDSEVAELDCTSKQTSFAAMGISSFMVSNLCNWLTNKKLGVEFRSIPFYTQMYFPIFNFKTEEVEVQLQQTV